MNLRHEQGQEYVNKEREKDRNEAMIYLIQHTIPADGVCKHFGCGKKLSLREGLFGYKCIHHQLK